MMSPEFSIPDPYNEPVKSYAPFSPERDSLKKALAKAWSSQVEAPMFIGGKEVISLERVPMRAPHNHRHILGYYHRSDQPDVKRAIQAAMSARPHWLSLGFEERAKILWKAADLLTDKYRDEMNAATMLGQSKNVFQSEIDAVCELADFWRYNIKFAQQIYNEQPVSVKGVWNRMDYRPLEGFVYALSPFNFTSIAGNLPTAPALMENTVVWKPANAQVYSAQVIMKILNEAGLPPGVINLIYPTGEDAAKLIFSNYDFAGIHFTGSTAVFRSIWKQIAGNIDNYKSYPKIVGETGGKDFVFVHESADIKAAATALTRGAFEYQGQKCSAASRAYIPSTRWAELKKYMFDDLSSVKVGSPMDFSCFMNAVIDEEAFNKISGYIDLASRSDRAKIIWGGKSDKSEGYFIEPTIIEAVEPSFITMKEEIFGPVLSVYVYNPQLWERVLWLAGHSEYALTGSVFATDRLVISQAQQALRYAAGNFYINDKPTGAVVGQQPFGGARASGTNDKAGSADNLRRWVSPRTIKETSIPPRDFRYPFMQA